MNIKQMTGVYFSPAGHTRKAVEMLLGKFSCAKESIDLTNASKRPDYGFTENEVVIVGVPVFAGRLPATAVERLKKLHGHRTPAILMVTYGNRAYEDALVELQDTMTAQGFIPVAAAAVVAEHSIAPQFAAGRPDQEDEKKLAVFAEKTSQYLKELAGSCAAGTLKVPGNHPYKEGAAISMKLKVDSGCNNCGTCIRECPVQAISRTDCRVVDEARCISCMRCASVCPSGHRGLGSILKFAVGQKLKKVCGGRKEPEFFYED